MKSFHSCLLYTSLVVVFLFPSNNFSNAQTYYWKDNAGNGNWDWGSQQWWSGGLVGGPTGSGAAVIYFENVGSTTTTINANFSGGWFKLNSLYAAGNSGGKNYVVNVSAGNSGIELYSKIETQTSSGTLSFANIDVQLGADSEINAVGNTVTLGGLRMNGKTLNSYGANSLNIQGAIIGSGTYNIKSQGLTVTYSGSSANTFSGTTTVENSSKLYLNKSANTAAIGGQLVINSGGTVRTDAAGQLNNQLVTVNGTLDLNNQNQSLALAGTSSGSVTLGSGTITINNSSGDSFAGVISGTGGLTKTGTGTQTLSGVNTFTGKVQINQGTLSIGAESGLGGTVSSLTADQLQFGGGTLAVTGTGFSMTSNRGITLNSGGGTIDVASGGSLTIQGLITGANALAKANSGILILSGNSGASFSGATTLTAGTLRLGHNSALGTGGLTLNGGVVASSDNTARTLSNALTIGNDTTFGESTTGTGTLSFGGAVGLGGGTRTVTINQGTTFSGAVTSGSLTKAGSAALTLGSDSSSFSTLTINAGSVAINGNTTVTGLSGSSGSVSVSSGKALTVNTGSQSTFGLVISGAGGLTKTGNSTLSLGGNNTFDGTTAVSAGTMAVTANNALGSTTGGTTVASGATLDFQNINYSTAEAVTLNGGSIAASTGTSTLAGGVTLGAASIYNIAGTQLTQSGVITDGASSFGITKSGSGTLVLSADNTYDGGTTINAGTVSIGKDLALGNAPGSAAAANITFNGGTLSATTGFTLNSNRGITMTGAGTVNVASASTLTYGGVIAGSGNLTKTGTGTLSLSGVATHSGNFDITEGVVALTGSGSLASSARINIGSGDKLDISGLSADTSVKILSEVGSGNGGSVRLGGRTLTVNGGVSGTTYQFQNIGESGDTGGLTLNSSGVELRLYGSGANSSAYTGVTTVAAGTLTVDGSLASTTINLTGGNLTMQSTADLANAAVITISSGSSTLTVGASDTIGSLAGTAGTVAITGTLTLGAAADTEFSGVMQGSGNLFKQGGGTFTLSGTTANTYTGTTTINNGTLVLNKTGVNALAGTPTINNGGTLKLGASDQIAGETTFLTINTGGTFDMNNFNETLSIQGAGTIKLGSGNLVINPTSATGDVFSGDIQGTGDITKQNTGVQVLSGASSYSGATAVNAGTLQIRNASALGTTAGATTVANNAALVFSNATSMSVAENLTLNGLGVGGIGGALANAGGSNTQSGSVTLGSSSRIAATAGSLAIQGGITGGNYVLFIGAAGGDISIGSIISGVGATQSGTTTSLFKDGTGILTLTGANTYSGDTRITQGTLTVGSGGNLGNGDSDVFISSGATLNVNADTTVDSVQETATSNGGVISIGTGATLTIDGASKGTFFQNSISGAGNLRMAGSGTTSLGLYGTQNYTGTTTVSNGTLSTGVALSTSGLILDGGVFETTGANIISSSSSVTINGGEFKFGNDSTDTDVVGVLAGTGGKLTLNAQMTTTSNTDSSYAGNISGSQGIVKQGTGILTLTGVSDGTGSFFIDQGGVNLNLASGSIGNRSIDIGGGVAGNSLNTSAVTLRVTSGSYNNTITINSEAGPASAASGNRTIDFANTSGTATLSGTVALEKSTTVSVASGGAGELTGAVTGAGGISKSGSGRLTLNNANNTYSGGTTLSAGQLRLGHQAAAGTGTITQSDGTSTLEIDTTGTVVNAMNIYNVSTLKTVTLSGNKTLNNATYDVAADTTTTESGLLSGNGGVTKKGAGELILGNTANSFTNIVDIQNGTLSASTIANSNSTSTIGQGPEVKIGSASTAGTFKYTGGTAGMNRTVTVGSAGGTIHVNDNAATMTLNGTVAGSGNTLTKTGAGILAFGSGSSVSLGTIAVQNGTLLLGAANQVGVATNSAANINLSGGTTLKTGFDLTGGTLTLSGTSSSADTIFDFDTGSGNDFAFASTVWSGGALKLANAKDGTVINFGSTFTGSWTDFQTKVAFGASPPSGSGISFGTTGGYTLTVAAIPDARVYTAAAFLLVLIGVTEYRRRRRPCRR